MTDIDIKKISFHLNEIQKILQRKSRYDNADWSTQRKVQCVETGDVYKSVRQAARMHNVTPALISMSCKGKVKSAAGFHWKYLN